MPSFDQQIRQLRRERLNVFTEAREIQQRITPDISAEELRSVEAEHNGAMGRVDEIDRQILDVEDKRDEATSVDVSRRPGAGGTIRGNQYDGVTASYDGVPATHEATSPWFDANSGTEVRAIPHDRPFGKPTEVGIPHIGAIARAMLLGPRNDAERRALSEGTDSAGGFTVPDPLSGNFIDLMRARSHVLNAGAVTVDMTSDTLKIAKVASDPSPGWRNEAASVAESDPTLANVAFTARTLGVLVKASRELLQDSVNIDQILQRLFAEAFAGELDRVALIGSGSAPEPEGITNTTGINSVSMGVNGAAVTNYAKILEALEALETDNAELPTAMVMHPRTRYAIAGLTATDDQPLLAPAVVQQVPMRTTSRVPIDDTQGTATDASRIVMGDFRQLYIGLRSSLRIEVLRERYADTLQTGFVAWMRADVQLAHPTAFCEIKGITP